MTSQYILTSKIDLCLSPNLRRRLQDNRNQSNFKAKKSHSSCKKQSKLILTSRLKYDLNDASDRTDCGRRAANSLTLALITSLVATPGRAEELKSAQTFMFKGAPSKKKTAYNLVTTTDEDVGFQIDLPAGWDMEVPGGRREYHAPKDYGGKRVSVAVAFLAKMKEPSLTADNPDVRAFAQAQADKLGVDANMGATAELLSVGTRDNGRYYYYEFRLNSFEPQHFWCVSGVGLGQNESARKFKLRQLVTVNCQIPEKEFSSEEDGEILRQIIASFNFIQ